MSVVARWFGDSFSSLHPQLQSLHREGGQLKGLVDIRYGSGLSGWLGKRLGRKLGLPADEGQHELIVDIRHNNEQLIWARTFNQQQRMVSHFYPYAHFPSGHWIEKTGPISISLQVDVVDGGWFWKPIRYTVFGVPLPTWLFPSSTAYKKVDNKGHYEFSVSFIFFNNQKLLSYKGLLSTG